MMNDGDDDDGAFRVDQSTILILIESCFDAGWYGVKFWGRVRGGPFVLDGLGKLFCFWFADHYADGLDPTLLLRGGSLLTRELVQFKIF
jgi:hypothetical protein